MVTGELVLTQVPAVQHGMIVHRPVEEVFRAMVDPEVTTRFWFTRSSGPVVAGAHVRWDWDMFGVSTEVDVHEVEENSRIHMTWGGAEGSTTVEWRFVPVGDDATCVAVTETGIEGTGDEVVAHAIDSMGGFTIVLCALKALLEHDVVLQAVRDHRTDCSSD
jgi:uncharacterized protein YndB with AHSA1/START domain